MKEFPEIEWTPDLVTTFWNYESRFPERYFTYHNGDELLRQIRPYLLGRHRVLDYGCGAGDLLCKLLDREYRAGRLDFSGESIKVITERFGMRENFLGAFQPDELVSHGLQFDAILVIEVIERLHDETLDEALETIKRVVRPEGVVIFTTPNEERLEDSKVLCPSCEKTFHRWQHVRTWSEQSLRGHLEVRGFQIVDSFVTDFKKLRKWRRFKKMKAFWRNLIYGPRFNNKLPHLAVVCRPSQR